MSRLIWILSVAAAATLALAALLAIDEADRRGWIP